LFLTDWLFTARPGDPGVLHAPIRIWYYPCEVSSAIGPFPAIIEGRRGVLVSSAAWVFYTYRDPDLSGDNSMADVMILAAGLGTRMKSERVKVLHELAGRPLISYAVRAALAIKPGKLFVIVGHQATEVEAAVRREVGCAGDSSTELVFVHQAEQRGTGHAVLAARESLAMHPNTLIVIPGDGPLLVPETLRQLLEMHSSVKNDATVVTVVMDDPTGYGRVVTDPRGGFVQIVEQKDATADQLQIHEVCVSIYCFETPQLVLALNRLNTDNAQGEYYLTDVPQLIKAQGGRVGTFKHDDPEELAGVNTRLDLAELERKLRERKARQL